jgi:hypothetical protein
MRWWLIRLLLDAHEKRTIKAGLDIFGDRCEEHLRSANTDALAYQAVFVEVLLIDRLRHELERR